MLSDALIAGALLLCLSAFFVVNAHNVMKGSRERRGAKVYAELERPSGVSIALAVLGTLSFFCESVFFVYMGFSDSSPYMFARSLQLTFPYDAYVQSVGVLALGAGCLIFMWSVVARGRYSVSWGMPEDHRLVAWGPYRYVRHPSYLGYFLMFVGFFLAWLNVVALVPLAAIPGYARVTEVEEELLTRDSARNTRDTGRKRVDSRPSSDYAAPYFMGRLA